MKKAWVFQDSRQKRKHGEKAPWSVGWREDGKRRSKKVGPRHLARRIANRIANDLNEGLMIGDVKIPSRIVRENCGYVYFMEAVGLQAVKIGAAANIDRRLGQLQVGCPAELRVLLLEEGGKARELELHREFEGFHIRGDWFRVDGAVADYIAQQTDNCMQN